VTPAVVGVFLLGDEVRPGWWSGAILGFAVTAAAAIVLVRFEGVRGQQGEAETTGGPAEVEAEGRSRVEDGPSTGGSASGLAAEMDGEAGKSGGRARPSAAEFAADRDGE
jgi:hypothetical protein